MPKKSPPDANDLLEQIKDNLALINARLTKQDERLNRLEDLALSEAEFIKTKEELLPPPPPPMKITASQAADKSIDKSIEAGAD